MPSYGRLLLAGQFAHRVRATLPETSAGILLFRKARTGTEVLLVHPGGPFWAKKDEGAWSLPKGLVGPDEDPYKAAQREFFEETGMRPAGAYREIGTFRQPSGKRLRVWALEGDFNPSRLASNTFAIVWPPKSGQIRSFPETDRAGWFGKREALIKILKGQRPILQAFYRSIA